MEMRDLLLLLGEGRGLQRKLRRPRAFERRIITGVLVELLVIQMHHNFHDVVEKIPVVRNEQQRARVAFQPVFKPHDGIEIEVVGGLIEQ